MIKKILLKIALVSLAINVLSVGATNSFFLDQETSQNNSFTAGCWGAPDNPSKISPNDFSASQNINFSWNSSTNHCPNSQTFYNLQIFTDVLGQNLYYQSGWITNTFLNLNTINDGHYWWRVQTKDENGYTNNNPPLWQLIVDITLPSSIITKPWNSDHDNDVTYPIIWFWNGKVEGTASDGLSGSGIDHVELSIYRHYVDKYWNGSNWVNGTESTVRVLAANTTNWSYEINPIYIPFGKFKIVAHAVDKAGNVENSATIEFEYIQDTPAPTFTTDINLSSNHIKNNINLEITNISSPLDYEILYTSNGLEKGISGHINSDEIIDSKYSKDFYLGTCSSGGMCTPEIIENGSIITINLTNGATLTKTFNY